MDIVQLGKTIRLIRQSRSLSQENVAEGLKISVTAYSKIERGVTNIPFSRLNQISEYFGMSAVALLEWNEKSHDNKKNYSDEFKAVNEQEVKYKMNSIIEHLKQENEQLKDLVKAKDEIIVLLKQKIKY